MPVTEDHVFGHLDLHPRSFVQHATPAIAGGLRTAPSNAASPLVVLPRFVLRAAHLL